MSMTRLGQFGAFAPQFHKADMNSLRHAENRNPHIMLGEMYFGYGDLCHSTTGAVGAVGGIPVIGMVKTELATSILKPVPQDCDQYKPAYVNVHFSVVDGTVTQHVEWEVKYGIYVPDTTAIAAPATALDTVLVTQVENDTPDTLQVTADPALPRATCRAGVINGGKITKDAMMAIKVTLADEESGSDPAVNLYGVTVYFTRDQL